MSNLIKYRPDIDGLRAISIISVLIFHLNPQWLKGGFLGVDFFFVISGYLITKILLRELQNNEFSFLRFYSRRIKRIFPALFLVLFVTSILATIILPSDYYKNFFKSFGYAVGQASNFFFARKADYFDDGGDPRALLHTWSLAVEEQFYLVWPMILFICAKTKNYHQKRMLYVILLVAISSFLLNVIWTNINANKSFYMFYTRAWEFCFGAIIALDIIPSLKRKWLNTFVASIALVLIIGSTIILGSSHLKLATIVGCFAVCLFIYSGQNQITIVHKIISFPLLVFVGLISYSLYLWHWPLIAFYKATFNELASWHDYIIVVALTFVISILSYRWVEKVRYTKTSDLKVLIFASVCLAISALIGNLAIKESHAEWRIKNPYAQKQAEQLNIDNIFFNIPDENQLKFKEYEVLVIGDSHATHYFPIIYKHYLEKGLRAKLISAGGCPPILGDYNIVSVRTNNITRDVDASCRLQQESILEAVKAPSLKYVFLAMRQDLYTENSHQKGFEANKIFLTKNIDGELTQEESRKIFSENLEYTIKSLRDLGKKVYLLGQVPVLYANPMRCSEITISDRLLYNHNQLAQRRAQCSKIDFASTNKRFAYSRDLYQRLVEKYQLGYFDPIYYFKSAMDSNGVVLYNDGDHINISGAKFIYQLVNFDGF